LPKARVIVHAAGARAGPVAAEFAAGRGFGAIGGAAALAYDQKRISRPVGAAVVFEA
jgi:hypothetical protein